MSWHVAHTRSLIERAFDREQLNLARPSIKSVSDRLDYARYHYQEAMRLIAQFASKYLMHQPLLALVFSNDEEERLDFEELMTQLGAHTIACVQSVHTLPDILGNLLYFSLGLNRNSGLKEQNISAAAVEKLLQRNSQYSALADALKQLTDQGSFSHLAALANHSKHRSIVQPQLNEDHTGLRKDRHEVRFSSFTYKGRVYPEVSVKELLGPEYGRCSEIVIQAGRDLNQVLQEIILSKPNFSA
jgi:hypothetical protein